MQNRKVSRHIASFLVIALIMLTLAGCEGAASAGLTSNASLATSDSPLAIDAGIILADREGYLCVALEQIGLPADAAVSSIASSCDCVQPSVIVYRTLQGTSVNGVLLRFVNEDSSAADPFSGAEISPVNLGVLIDLKLADGATRRFTINLLHTSLAQEAAQ